MAAYSLLEEIENELIARDTARVVGGSRRPRGTDLSRGTRRARLEGPEDTGGTINPCDETCSASPEDGARNRRLDYDLPDARRGVT